MTATAVMRRTNNHFPQVPGAPPLKTVYRTVDSDSNITISRTVCNTSVFKQYFRTNLYNCAKGCGPFQDLDNDCNIIIEPVFTGPTCGGPGGYTM